MLSSQHVEFERRVGKFPYQLFEVFELFLPTQEFIRNNGYVDVAQPLTFSLDYRAVEIYFRLNCFSCLEFFEVFYFILFKNCRKEDPAVLPSKRAGMPAPRETLQGRSPPFQILNCIFHECIRSLQQNLYFLFHALLSKLPCLASEVKALHFLILGNIRICNLLFKAFSCR